MLGTVLAAVALFTYINHGAQPAQTHIVQAAQQTPGPVQAPEKPQFPRMELQAQYAGPLQDTIIQRWRDPIDGTVCYLYLPILVHHSPPTPTGFVEYGSNTVGSISCMAGNAAPPIARR